MKSINLVSHWCDSAEIPTPDLPYDKSVLLLTGMKVTILLYNVKNMSSNPLHFQRAQSGLNRSVYHRC